jgi:hypothetical protein
MVFASVAAWAEAPNPTNADAVSRETAMLATVRFVAFLIEEPFVTSLSSHRMFSGAESTYV